MALVMEYDLDVNALRASFLVAAQDPDLMLRFYARLFSRHPSLCRLFDGRVMPVQSELVTRALFALLDQLEQPALLRKNLHALGVRHLRYGVSEEMYAWVGVCFVDTLAESLGTSWTPRIQVAWQEAYGVVAALMVEGAELSGVPTLRAAS